MDRRTALKIATVLLTVNTASAKEMPLTVKENASVERIDNTLVVSSEGQEGIAQLAVSAVQALARFMQEKGLEVDAREDVCFQIEFLARNGEIEGKPAWKLVSSPAGFKTWPDGRVSYNSGLLGGMQAIVGPRDKKDRLTPHDIENGRMVSIIERAFDLTVRQKAKEELEALGEKTPSSEKRQAAQEAVRASLNVTLCKLFVPIA
jgi:hypothetical protein